MSKLESFTNYSLLGIVFVAAGVLILVLCVLNYLQDGKISTSAVIGLMAISAGLFMYARNKKSNGE